MKILVCFGTRPEAIKMAPVCIELSKHKISYKICVTAQHREMLDQVLDFFELIPDYDLNLMKAGQNLNDLSSLILKSVDNVFEKEEFDLVLVHGDTTTSTMVALAAFHRGIKVGHVEAGLRTYNKKAPFPEEINRQLTAKIADYHFAPTKLAEKNLLNEGIQKSKIFLTGNTVIDALLFTIKKINNGFTNETIDKLKKEIDFNKKILLVTGHRRENFGEGIINICNAIIEVSKNQNIEVVFPVHLNPNVKETVYSILSNKSNIHLIQPINYPSFVWLMSKSSLILSDSGGIQEEAPTLGKKVIVTRTISERSEAVKTGFSFLVGCDTSKIIATINSCLKKTENYSKNKNPFGSGKASVEIVNNLKILI